LAVADGTVVVAKDLFFPGNAVFIDHGDGLISMSFHLSEIKVKAGQQIKKGDTVAPPGRISSSASAGTAPASTPTSCLRTRPRSRPWAPEQRRAILTKARELTLHACIRP
jgi:septal ring factor EnvC (AmiA/AmiB activator)